ncbi:MAG TPA: hypothetical protein VKN99_14810 [Polyangia bacterium]|nr:hypothetical protein [Polyangia bacterium]
MRRIDLLACLAIAAAGCDINTPTYFQGMPLEVGGKTPDGMDRPSSATDTLEVKFRAPSASDTAALMAEQQRLGLQQPVPWLKRSDLAIEVAFTLRNLDDKPGIALVMVNGANEFTNYDVAAIVSYFNMNLANAQDRPVVLPLIQAVPVMVPAHQTYQGVVREDDFTEAELDLDAIGRYGANAASVLINRSEVNPIGLEMVPKNEVVPAMFRILFTVSADTHMTCDYVVRVRDGADRLWDSPSPQFMPAPMDYMPALPGM